MNKRKTDCGPLLKAEIRILQAIYAVIKLMPVTDKVTFISRESDSPSIDIITLKEYLESHLDGYKIEVLSKRFDKGIRASLYEKISYAFHMLHQMCAIATSRVVILDSYCMCISLLEHKKSLTVIQMWHSVGSMKKFGYAMTGKKEGSSPELAKTMMMHRNYDYALISSFSFVNDYVEGFHMDPERIKEIPLPRVDLLTSAEYREKNRKILISRYPVMTEKKNILYCPTFRRNEEGMEKAVSDLSEMIDHRRYNLIVSFHPLSSEHDLPKDALSFNESTFDLLFTADYVVSDYSSVIYEAGLLKVPFMHYAYDYGSYCDVRDMNIDLEKESPGLFTADPGMIVRKIEEDRFDESAYDAFVQKNVRKGNDTCCSQIFDLIKSEVVNS